MTKQEKIAKYQDWERKVSEIKHIRILSNFFALHCFNASDDPITRKQKAQNRASNLKKGNGTLTALEEKKLNELYEEALRLKELNNK